MQESYTRIDWQEDPTEEKLRWNLNEHSHPDLVRRLYPLSAKLITKDPAYGYPVGYIFKYARTKKEASVFPIEVCVIFERHRTSSLLTANHFSSEEVELVLP